MAINPFPSFSFFNPQPYFLPLNEISAEHTHAQISHSDNMVLGCVTVASPFRNRATPPSVDEVIVGYESRDAADANACLRCLASSSANGLDEDGALERLRGQ